MNTLHFVVLLLSIFVCFVVTIQVFGCMMPNRICKELSARWIITMRKLIRRIPALKYVTFAFQVFFTLLWIKLNWMDVAAFSIYYLAVTELGMWMILKHEVR